MSSKCSGCGYYKTACQCRKDDNYCICGRVISDCRCPRDHHDHWSYDNRKLDKFDNDDPCNDPVEDGRYDNGNDGNHSDGGNYSAGGNGSDGGNDDD